MEANQMIDVKLSKKSIGLKDFSAWDKFEGEGCVNIFIGKVKPKNKDRNVIYLDFEVYESMALSKMKEIAKNAKKKFEIDKILMIHRIGKVSTGEIPVIIAVSAARRRPAIQACQYLIDTLKAVVPIWKKEVYDNGEEWVSAHP